MKIHQTKSKHQTLSSISQKIALGAMSMISLIALRILNFQELKHSMIPLSRMNSLIQSKILTESPQLINW